MKTTNTDIIKEFRKMFSYGSPVTPDMIESWLTQKLDQVRGEEREEIIERIRFYSNYNANEVADILEEEFKSD